MGKQKASTKRKETLQLKETRKTRGELVGAGRRFVAAGVVVLSRFNCFFSTPPTPHTATAGSSGKFVSTLEYTSGSPAAGM